MCQACLLTIARQESHWNVDDGNRSFAAKLTNESFRGSRAFRSEYALTNQDVAACIAMGGLSVLRREWTSESTSSHLFEVLITTRAKLVK